MATLDLVLSAIFAVFLGIAALLFGISYRRVKGLGPKIDDLEEGYQELKHIEERVTGGSNEDFDQKISKISEKLRLIAQERYSLEEASSFNSLIGELESEKESDALAEDLLNSFRYLEKKSLQDNLDKRDRRLIREASFGILRFPTSEEESARTGI